MSDSEPIGTIREFRTRNFRVIVEALPEWDDVDVDDNGETAAKVASGEYIHFMARARVLYKGDEVACDYLGSCIYASLEDFADHKQCAKFNRELEAAHPGGGKCGSYFADMVREVIKQARKAWNEPRPMLRGAA